MGTSINVVGECHYKQVGSHFVFVFSQCVFPMFGFVSSSGFYPAEVFPQLRFFSSLKGKSVNIMQLHLTTTPLKSEVLCCAPSGNNHLFFWLQILPCILKVIALCVYCGTLLIIVFSVRVRIHYGSQHCIQQGLVYWVGGPAGPEGIKMVQIQCWATCTELQWAPWSLEHFVSACIQPIICSTSTTTLHENTQAHARPCLGQALQSFFQWRTRFLRQVIFVTRHFCHKSVTSACRRCKDFSVETYQETNWLL